MERKFAIIGHPLGHSLSPQIHERLFKLSGRKAEYGLMDIPPEELLGKAGELKAMAGFNITIPHKVAIIPMCDELSPEALRYGSVNCVKNVEKTVGYNTDVLGFTRSIQHMGATLSGRVLLIGCGGVGRMMAIETALSGGNLTIAVLENEREKAEKVSDTIKTMKPDAKVSIAGIKGNVLDIPDLAASEESGKALEFDLLINATPVGMYPKTDNMPCTADVVKGIPYVFDAVYNPVKTLLYKTAVQNGSTAMTGMAMLVLQAAAAHEIWDGDSYSQDQLQAIISEMESYIS